MNLLNIDIEQSLIKFIHDKRVSITCMVLISLMILLTLVSFFSIFSYLNRTNANAKQLNYQKQEIQEITKPHIFGEFKEDVPAVTPVTPINLSLQAIFYSENDNQKSGALI